MYQMPRGARWPSFGEQLTINVIVSLLGAGVVGLFTLYRGLAERILIVGSAGVLVLLLAYVVERLRTERISVFFTEQDYEDHLSTLARRHSGSISWVTKTSIWADLDSAHDGRLTAKLEGLRSGRLTSMRYILHLGYWRRLVTESLSAGSKSALDVYDAKVNTLLRHVEDYTSCPPESVQIVAGNLEESGPLNIYGIYRAKRSQQTTVVLGYDALSAGTALPRLSIRSHTPLVRFYESLFDEQWHTFQNRVLRSQPALSGTTEGSRLRQHLIEILRTEATWIASLRGTEDVALNSNIMTRRAISLLNDGKTLILSCPQKVCISGDYGDMQQDGVTLSAAINVRAHLTIRRCRSESSATVHSREGAPSLSNREWPLVEIFKENLRHAPGEYEVDVYPASQTGLGLGSSGAGSLLLAWALAIAEGRDVTLFELIHEAHRFETELAGWPCGPQDHAISVLGGVRLIHYPTLSHTTIHSFKLWDSVSFWSNNESRDAHAVIPQVLRDHSRPFWSLKRELTKNIADAFLAMDILTAIECMARESDLQAQLRMVTKAQLEATAKIRELGGAAKVSGAGGGGVLVALAPNALVQPKINSQLQALGFTSLPLSPDAQGLCVEASE